MKIHEYFIPYKKKTVISIYLALPQHCSLQCLYHILSYLSLALFKVTFLPDLKLNKVLGLMDISGIGLV